MRITLHLSVIVFFSVFMFFPIIGFSQTTWFVPDDFAGIQLAISDASMVNGDTLIVRGGYYYENIDFLGKAITVKSELGPDGSFIDGNQLDSVVKFINGEGPDSVLEGFTLMNGLAVHGGGVYCDQSSPTLSDIRFFSNSATEGGGGMTNMNCNPTLTDCMFIDNQTDFAGGGMENVGSSPILENCSFLVNKAYKGDFGEFEGGGGMHNRDYSSPTLSHCTFTGNWTECWAGGMLNFLFCSPTLAHCSFIGNVAADRFGGMACIEESNAVLTHCAFIGNEGSSRGGGMNVESSHIELSDCTFSNNESNEGGGIDILGCTATLTRCTFNENTANRGGGISIYYKCNVEIHDCILTGNTSYFGGGGINCEYDSSLELSNCTITDNYASGIYGYGHGGGLHIKHCQCLAIATNCIFSGNLADDFGGGLMIHDGSLTLSNCTFFENSAVNGSGMASEDASATVTNCILWNDMPGEIYVESGDDPMVTFSCVKGGYTGTGNIDIDPCFADPLNNDFHLSAHSPCIDAGDNFAPSLPLVDCDGDPRIYPGNGSGYALGAPSQNAVVDMGIDEYCLTNCSNLVRK